MNRRVRPHLCSDTTSSLSTRCLRTVEAKIVIEAERVLLDKGCASRRSTSSPGAAA